MKILQKPQDRFYSPARGPYSSPIWTVQSTVVNRTVHRVDYRILLEVLRKISFILSRTSIFRQQWETEVIINDNRRQVSTAHC